jgi:Flp pilus assembly protein CpaB
MKIDLDWFHEHIEFVIAGILVLAIGLVIAFANCAPNTAPTNTLTVHRVGAYDCVLAHTYNGVSVWCESRK